MLFKESHYGAKAPQNMVYKEQNKTRHSMIGSPEGVKIQRSLIPKIRKN